MPLSEKLFNAKEEQKTSLDVPKEEQEAAKERLVKLLSNGDIGATQRIITTFNFPKELLNSEEVQEAAKKRLVKLLSNGYIGDAHRIITTFNLPSEIVQEAAKEGLIESFSSGDIEAAQEIITTFNFPKELLNSEEVQEAAKERLVKLLLYGYIGATQRIITTFNFPKELLNSGEVQEAAKEGLVESLSNGHIEAAQEIITTFNFPKELLNSGEVQEAAKEGLIESFSSGDIEAAQEIITTFNFPKELLNSEEVQEAAKERLVKLLSNGDIGATQRIITTFNFPKELLNSGEVQEAAKKRLVKLLSSGDIEAAQEIITTFNFPKELLNSEEVQEATKERLVKLLSNGYIGATQRIITTFNLPSEIVQEAGKEGLVKLLSNGYIGDAHRIITTFNLPSEIVQEAAKEGLVESLSNGHIGATQRIITTFNLPSEIVQEAAKEGLIESFSSGDIEAAQEIITTFNFPKELLNSEEVQEAGKEGLVKLLSSGDIGDAHRIITTFNFPKELLNSGEVQEAYQKLSLPFTLERAFNIIESDRFGRNLLNKFHEFDDVAQRAVCMILKNDERISASIDRRSLEYRRQVQQELEAFGKNRETLSELRVLNIDTDMWLNYENVSYFELGQADELTFGQRIEQPVKRLPESIKKYVESILGAMQEYKIELKDTKIAVDVTALETELETLQSVFSTETDPLRRSGIERGIASLEERIKNPKMIRVWDKLSAEISKLENLAREVSVTNESLIALEGVKISLISDDAIKESLKHKSEVWSTRKKLTHDLTKLRRRLDDIFTVYQDTLGRAIGNERADGVMQQVRGEIQEFADHLNTDFHTITSFIQEDIDAHEHAEDVVSNVEVMDDSEYTQNRVAVTALTGRPMSIRVGGRSRQDLYLGNYTTCCIRIDSEYHNKESPIADYVTDLGMQNVILYDEVTKTPVACAWCWIGVDPTNGNLALVIDNVEGWQKYTVNFQSQLKETMHMYLRAYADAIRVDTLAQGPDYNDLNILPEDEQSEQYIKLGGYNRADGYYLEAEFDGSDYDDSTEVDEE